MSYKPGTSVVCIDCAPVHGIKQGQMALTKGKTYTVLDYQFELDGVVVGLNPRYVAITGDDGGLIVCKSERFK